jgi:hypothetical protein
MMNSFRGWLRVVISPWYLVFVWCLIVPPMYILRAVWTIGAQAAPDAELDKLTHFYSLVGAFFYGFYRGSTFHPLTRPNYKDWLLTTVWQPTDPLPFGPIHLVVQDLFVLGLLVVPMSFLIGISVINIPVCFLAVYTLNLMSYYMIYQPRKYAYVIVFCLSSLPLTFLVHPLWSLAVSVGYYGVARLGLRVHMNYFPWGQRKPEPFIGYPMSSLQPYPEPDFYSRWEEIILGLLAGWITFVFIAIRQMYFPTLDSDYYQMTFIVFLLPMMTVCVCYLFLYFEGGHSSPIGIEGRLRSGRIIIPKYDIVFLPIILAFLLLYSLPILCNQFGVHPLIGIPITCVTPVVALCCFRPDRLKWRLTAPIRLAIPKQYEIQERRKSQ